MPDPDTGVPSGAVLLPDPEAAALWGPAGSLPIPAQDRITRKLAMLYEGECSGLGVARTAAKYGYSRQGYYRLLKQFRNFGAAAFLQRPGPKRNYRRGEQVVRAVVRLRFQDPDRSTPELVGALREAGFRVSARSVERIISDYGLHRRAYPPRRTRPHRGRQDPPRHAISAARLPDCVSGRALPPGNGDPEVPGRPQSG